MNRASSSILCKKSQNILILLFLALSFLLPSLAFADAASLLKSCESYLLFEEGGDISKLSEADYKEASYCPGYIEATLELNLLYQAQLGKAALFCLPEEKLERMTTIKMVIGNLKTLPEKKLKQDATFHLLSIFAGKYPCIR